MSPDPDYLPWLLDHSMLEQAKAIAARCSGQGRMWQHPYAQAQPRAAAAKAAVWLTAYPAAVITREGESVLQTLGSEELWQAFQAIGIQALHTGPMKVAGVCTDASLPQPSTAFLTGLALPSIQALVQKPSLLP